MHIVVLGCGLVGSTIARELSRDFSVTAADRNEEALAVLSGMPNLAMFHADLSVPENIVTVIADADLVIGAVPGFMGFQMLHTVIDVGKNIVDISFFPEDPFQLDTLAKERGVTAVMDCGLAPGIGNILLGRTSKEFESIDRFTCLVGGLPMARRKPYEYAAVFSPIDVIEEYTRPARFVENGIQVTREALSEVELIDFDGVGTLEAFNTDGLRTLAVTMQDIPNMKEKTMRYPGHADLMRTFRDTGFFSHEEIEVNGVHVRPIDLTSRLLFPAWKLREGEQDLSVMRVEITGMVKRKLVSKRWDLLDRYDSSTNTTSMARTTGYTCAVAARLVADGTFVRPGLCPPEYLGMEERVYEKLLQGLHDHGIRLTESEF